MTLDKITGLPPDPAAAASATAAGLLARAVRRRGGCRGSLTLFLTTSLPRHCD